MSQLFDNTFGNYMLHGIDEITMPEPVSWWPQTIGWQLLALLAAIWAARRLYLAARRWWSNRYRRHALAQLAGLQQESTGESYERALAALPALLKGTALHAYPRSEVAALSGEPWLAFLDAHYDTRYKGPCFRGVPGRNLLTIAYQPGSERQIPQHEARQLLKMSRRWLARHRVVAGENPDDA